ncbi:MAG: protein TolR [Pseudomonadota bacterium]
MAMSVKSGGGGGKGGRRRRGGAAPMAEINVTPFVDVMLVLLIIFMVSAPLLTAGVPLELPETAAKPLPSENKPPLTVSVDGEGKIYLGELEHTRNSLMTALEAEIAERASDRIYLRADGDVGYARVMEVMGLLNASGFRNLGLVTKPSASGGGQAEAQPEQQ